MSATTVTKKANEVEVGDVLCGEVVWGVETNLTDGGSEVIGIELKNGNILYLWPESECTVVTKETAQ